MLNNKNCAWPTLRNWAGIAVVCGLLGCTPPGPKALLEGRHLLDEGRMDEAISRLQRATDLMPTNSLAWSSLGVAYHQSGRHDQAFKAYQTALKLDHTMRALRFNLGCLYLDMNNVGAALDELRAFTLLQPNSFQGWLKLGTAQYRARRLDDAEKSFKNALGLQPRNPEAWNGQGLIQVQRRRWPEAISFFSAALAADTNFAPALLNAAVVHHQYVNNRPLALRQYRQYLEMNPDGNAQVRGAVAQLERELSPAAPSPVPSRVKTNEPIALVATTIAAKSNAPPAPASAPTAPARTQLADRLSDKPKPSTSGVTVAVAAKPTLPPVEASSPPRAPGRALDPAPTGPAVPVSAVHAVQPVAKPTNQVRPPEPTRNVATSVVTATMAGAAPNNSRVDTAPPTAAPAIGENPTLEAGPARENLVVRPAHDPGTPGAVPVADTVAPGVATASPSSAEAIPPPAKKGFLSRLNPFGRSGRASNGTEFATAPPDASSRNVPDPDVPPGLAPAIPRYAYLSPRRPSSGNREAALVEFRRGVTAHTAGNRAQAAANYQAAVRADPGLFDAYYNLGLVALDSGDNRLSLWAYEIALALQPDSADARYNFALALKAGGFSLDAADQLRILLRQDSGDARAHLSLANLFAQQLKETGPAREHYLRVLDLDPKHPDAPQIRYWLAANP